MSEEIHSDFVKVEDAEEPSSQEQQPTSPEFALTQGERGSTNTTTGWNNTIVEEETASPGLGENLARGESFLSNDSRKHHADHVFDQMTPLRRKIIFFCLLALSVFQLAIVTNIWIAWETLQQEKKGQSQSTISFVISGFGLGSIFGVLFLKKILMLFSRKGVWLLLVGVYWLALNVFITIDYFMEVSLAYNSVCCACLFIIGSTQIPTRALSMSTTTKLYPINSAVMLQYFSLSMVLGSILGPLSAGIFLDIVGFNPIIYTYATLIFIIMVIGLVFIPKTHPQTKKDHQISRWTIASNWRGFSNLFNELVAGLLFRILVNGVALFTNKDYGYSPVIISYIVDGMTVCSVILTFTTIFMLKRGDHRLVYIFCTLIGSGTGYMFIGGFFCLRDQPFWIVSIGLVLSQFAMSGQACENMDLITVCQEILQKEEVPISIKDTISSLVMLMFAISTFLGSFSLGFLIDYVDFQTLMSASGVILICLSANYFFATGVLKRKKTPLPK